ncbi:MAG: AtpZ/AtpI family protein [Candidatus Obscuribacterales bacterium]|nr:AtpZ/AtpI family protein [Candidatus Obscuribacterales bacterium]
MDKEPNGEGTPSEPEQPDGKKDPQLPADPSTSQEDNPNQELKKQTPEEERRERFQWVAASQFAYTLVGATLLLGWLGHWLGNKLGEPWNLILMLLFGGTGFVLEMWRMIRFVTPKDNKKDKSEDADKGDKGNDKKS